MMENELAEPDLTPMLDVVFIMLVFFIVTATFVKEVGIELPASDSKSQQASADAVILVEVDEGDRYYLEQKQVDARALEHHLARLHAEHPDRKLIIKPDSTSTTAAVVYAMDVARLVGLAVGLAELEPAS